MKKRVVTLIVLCVLSVIAYCATVPKPGMRMNAVSGELGGNGLFLSVNYGRVIAVEDGYFVAGQLGIGLGYAF